MLHIHIYDYIYIYIYIIINIYIYVLSLLCLFFNVTSKIFHTITFLHKSLRKWLIFWASNHDVNCCLANWALLVQHQMPAEWNQRPATKPLHLRERWTSPWKTRETNKMMLMMMMMILMMMMMMMMMMLLLLMMMMVMMMINILMMIMMMIRIPMMMVGIWSWRWW